VRCDGGCTVDTPSDLGQVATASYDINAGFTFGGSENVTVGGPCMPGYQQWDLPTPVRLNNKGDCGTSWTDPANPADCTVTVHLGASFLEGNVECLVVIDQVRVCGP